MTNRQEKVHLWLTQFTLGTIVTLSLVVGGGMISLYREVAVIHEMQRATDVKVTWLISVYLNSLEVKDGPGQRPISGSSSRWIGWSAASDSQVFRSGPQTEPSRANLSPGSGRPGSCGGS